VSFTFGEGIGDCGLLDDKPVIIGGGTRSPYADEEEEDARPRRKWARSSSMFSRLIIIASTRLLDFSGKHVPLRLL
jgi:hypothetical protein